MSKEETVEKTDTTEEVVEEKVEEAPAPEETEEKEETTETPKEEEIDYEAIEKEEVERKPDPNKAKEAFKKRKEKREEVEEEEEDDEKPLTKSELQTILAENNAKTQKVLIENNAKEMARNISDSDAEANAILARWRNRIFPEDMPVAEQIEEMYISVNRKKIISQKSEALRALQNRDSVSRDSASSHKDAPEKDAPKLSQNDAQAYKSAGFVWDGRKRLYKKQLGGPKSNKFLYKDPKTGNQWRA